MADTGWLRPAASTISVPPVGINGATWLRKENFAQPIVYATDSWAAMGTNYWTNTQQLAWDWLIPQGLSIPLNAVVVGIELDLWGYYYQHNTGNPDVGVHYVQLDLGDATLFNESPGNPASELFRILTSNDFPPDPQAPPLAEHKLTFGGATSLFGLSAGTRVTDFLAQDSSVSGTGAFHASLVCEMGSTQLYQEIAVYLSYCGMRVHYEVEATQIDLPATELEAVVSIDTVNDLQVIRRLEAIVAIDATFDSAILGGDGDMTASFEIVTEMPNDLTNGAGYVDSSASPTAVVSLSAVGLEIVRHKDMMAEIVIEAEFRVSGGVGVATDMEASPVVNTSLIHEITGVLDMSTDDGAWVVTTLESTGLQSQFNMESVPLVVASLTDVSGSAPKLEGTINLAAECGEYPMVVVVTIPNAEIGVATELYATPTVIVSLEGVDDLGNAQALEAQPCVVVTIPLADLQSKYSEPAPDERTLYVCPVDHTIYICRQDTSTL